MGMFDELKCRYPLPVPEAQDWVFQTKDTPAQYCDNYEIRADGTLWHESFDEEDQSDPKAIGFSRIIGMCTRVNKRWEPVNFTGEIRFYTVPPNSEDKGWIEFSSYLVNGKLNQLHLIEYRKAGAH